MNHPVIIECGKSQLTRKEGGIRAGVCLDKDLFLALEKVGEMDVLNSLSGDCSTCSHNQVEALSKCLHTHLN